MQSRGRYLMGWGEPGGRYESHYLVTAVSQWGTPQYNVVGFDSFEGGLPTQKRGKTVHNDVNKARKQYNRLVTSLYRYIEVAV